MKIEETALPGVRVLTPRRSVDVRGWFSETWSRHELHAQGISLDFVQDNHSLSLRAGTVRGLHFQRPPHAQAKLVRVVAGAVLDVAVDARRGSPSYGRWVAVELSAENGRQILIPEGFLHGFVTKMERTEVVYKCTDRYAPDCESAVAWDDPDLSIDWGLDPGDAVLSDKDRTAPGWAGLESPFEWEAQS